MENHTLPQLLDLLWNDYVETNTPAQHNYNLFASKGEKVINDHVAFRTYNHPLINVDVLGKVFTGLGYDEKADYHFEKKKLYAKHYEHPNSEMPLIFISQLKVEEFDEGTRKIINGLTTRRYRKPNGDLFRGFISGSADKIFESTDKGQDYNLHNAGNN